MSLSPSLVIERVEIFLIELPVRRVRRHGSGDVAGSIRNMVVKLSADGLTGWGEAAPWPVFTGTAEACAAAVERYIGPAIQGQNARHVPTLLSIMDRAVVGHPEAKAAIEMAALDLCGKALDCPVSDLVGGLARPSAPLSVSLADPDVDADLDFARKLYGDGIRIFKVKTGFLDHADEVRRLERLLTELPGDVRWRVDYNQGLSPLDAKRCLADLDGFGFEFIEQPVPRDRVDILAELRRRLRTPIQADESVFTPADAFHVCRAQAADVVSVKVMKSGGILRGQQIASICEAAGVACYGGDMFETGLAHAAGAHLVGTAPNISTGCEFYHASYHLTEDILATPFPVADGHVIVPRGPGLGVVVDEEKLRRFAAN